MAGSSLQTMVRDLHRRRGRERRGLVLLEGVRLVEDALAAGASLRGAIVSAALEGTPRGVGLKVALGAATARVEVVSEAELEALSATDHPQGIIAIAEPPAWKLEQIPTRLTTTILVLDGVQDPGNVGTIVRTALGLGAQGVVALPGTAEFTNPKTLRATMGAFFRLPCVVASDEELSAWLTRHRVELWLGDASGERVDGRGGTGPLAIGVGNEGAGARAELVARAGRTVRIPLVPGAESLNVAVAAGILLWEVTRGG